MAGISFALRWPRWFSIFGGCAAAGVRRRSRRRRPRKIPRSRSEPSRAAVLRGGSSVQHRRADRPGHGRRLDAERRIVIGIEAAQLPSQPCHEALVAGATYIIAAASIVLERIVGDHDADHARSFAGAERAAHQPPRGQYHHVLRAARYQDARVVAQLTLDEFAKVIAIVLHRVAEL